VGEFQGICGSKDDSAAMSAVAGDGQDIEQMACWSSLFRAFRGSGSQLRGFHIEHLLLFLRSLRFASKGKHTFHVSQAVMLTY